MDLFNAIKNRRSVRSYLPKPIPDDVMGRMKQAIRFAPSACNLQPWHFIFVTDAKLRQEIIQLANGQAWIAVAPVIVVACGFPNDAYKNMGGHGNSVDIDVAIAVDHLTLAAVADGLATCWIGAFDEARLKTLLDIPRQAKVVGMTPLGYPASPDLNHPIDPTKRKPDSEIFSHNRYARPSTEKTT